jgi:hypothetical protein
MRINPYVGISRMIRFRMVDMCKGKRKYDNEAPTTSSLSDCTWLEKSESFVSQQRDILPCTFIFSFHLIHPSHIFLATPLLSFYSSSSFHSYIYIYIFSFLFYFSFFLFPTHTFFFIFPSLDIFFSLFKAFNSSFFACIQSEILNKPC